MIRIDIDLSEINIPVYAEGDAPETLPDEYFTFNEDYSSDGVCADNEPKTYVYEFTLKYYTKNAETLYSRLLEAIQILKRKKYIITGVGYANSTYQSGQTKWFSRMVDIKAIEYLKKEVLL